MEPKYIKLEERLKKEIGHLKNALLSIEEDDTKSSNIIDEHTKQIKEVLQTISHEHVDIHQFSSSPIHELLENSSFNKTEIPLEIIEILLSAGFDADAYSGDHQTCLYRAIQYQQYNVVRLLITKGAKCDKKEYFEFSYDTYDSEDYVMSHIEGDHSSPAAALASHEKVPLDLFDLLATQQSLNLNSDSESLPLHIAARYGYTKIAKYLIKLGASVNKLDQSKYLPMYYFMLNYFQYSEELFMSLLPSKPRGIDVLRVIWSLLNMTREKMDSTKLEMLHQLLQRLHFTQPLKLRMFLTRLGLVDLVVNGETVTECNVALQSPYLCCLVLVSLEFNVVLIDCNIVPGSSVEREFRSCLLLGGMYDHQKRDVELKYASLIQQLCKMNRQKCKVKSLVKLCILQIRSSMNSLDDDSFLSLPVPPCLRKLLTYRDVAEVIFEEWRNGPMDQ